MPLTGKRKRDYQREYMRRRRAVKAVRPSEAVRPFVRPCVRPCVRPQSYNPMMVGYEPPRLVDASS